MSIRRFEFIAGTSAKFWEIGQQDKQITVRYGRIGTDGQTRSKQHNSPNAAKETAAKLVAQKAKKGYREVSRPLARRVGSSEKPKARKTDVSLVPPTVDSASAIPHDEVVTFVGLVDPSSGGGGCRSGRATHWTFSASLIAWRVGAGPIVRENLDVIAPKIGDRKLATLMKHFAKWRILAFTAKRATRQTRMHTTVELVKYLGEASDKDLSRVKNELSQPVAIRDRTFGIVNYEPEQSLFSGQVSHGGEALNVWFDTESIDVTKQMMSLARPLWRSRVKWFRDFRSFVTEKMFAVCQEWRASSDKEPLTPEVFKQLLGNPCGLTFRMRDAELEFEMSGWSEDCFGGHGVRVTGTLRDGMIDAEIG